MSSVEKVEETLINLNFLDYKIKSQIRYFLVRYNTKCSKQNKQW